MSEQDVVNYIRKCTAILLQKMDHLNKKIERLELLEGSHITLERVFSKRFQQEYFASLREEEDILNQINRVLGEFREEMERLRKRQ